MRKLIVSLIILSSFAITPAFAQVKIGGFLQGLYGARLDDKNPTATEYTAAESRLQLRLEHSGSNAEFSGKVDFFYDDADIQTYDWELREGFLKFRLGNNVDFKAGRQILTWGTGDLIFINDVFAKDYRSFFVGRDDQYLKAPQDAIRMEYYNPLADLAVVWTPRFEPNRLPTGRVLSYYDPLMGEIVGVEATGQPVLPPAKFDNSEIAARLSRQIGAFNAALYFYRGFYKNPNGYDLALQSAIYPRLNVYGASARGSVAGGVFWLEGGYFHSRDDEKRDNPFLPNSSLTWLAGYERQVAANLTANLQWQADYMLDYDTYQSQQSAGGGYVRDEVRHLLTSRITKLLNSELLMLSGFVFYSPTDEDAYVRLLAEYKYSDEVRLAIGGNIFAGKHEASEFGQFQRNDNVYVKMTYWY